MQNLQIILFQIRLVFVVTVCRRQQIKQQRPHQLLIIKHRRKLCRPRIVVAKRRRIPYRLIALQQSRRHVRPLPWQHQIFQQQCLVHFSRQAIMLQLVVQSARLQRIHHRIQRPYKRHQPVQIFTHHLQVIRKIRICTRQQSLRPP